MLLNAFVKAALLSNPLFIAISITGISSSVLIDMQNALSVFSKHIDLELHQSLQKIIGENEKENKSYFSIIARFNSLSRLLFINSNVLLILFI